MDGSENEESKQWPQYVATVSITCLAVSVGLHFSWPSPAKLRFEDLDFPVSSEQLSYIVMVSPLGYLIGCPVTAFFLDTIGRKLTVLLLAGPQILAWILIAASINVNMIYSARVISGIAEGGALTSVALYVGEISESKVRGALGMSYPVGVMCGCMLMNIYGSFLDIRISAYVSIVVPMIFLITFVWMPESPYFCIMKGRIDEARKSLQRLRWINNVERELNQLILDVQRQTSEKKRFRDIFIIKSNLKAFLIIIGVRTLQQFSGGASINLYNQFIFEESGTVYIVLSAVLFHASMAIVSCCGSLIIDKKGRRPLLIISATGISVCLFFVGLYFCLKHYREDVSRIRWIVVTSLVLYTIARGLGLMSIPSVLTGELFSASVKAKAVFIINIYFALCISTSSKLFHWLQAQFGMHVPFFFFSIFCIFGIFFVYFFVPETKGKTLEEIQQELKGN